MQTLGTILPTRKSLETADRFADRLAADDIKKGDALFGSNVRNQVAGETRWSLSMNRYAVVKHGKARVFETRADGDYAVK